MAGTPAIITWVDPGLTTGIASWYPATSEFYSTQVFGILEAAFQIRDTLTVSSDAGTSPVVGWEDFVIRPGSSHLDLDTSALELIGAMKVMAADLGATVLCPQQPADRSLGEKHLKTLGWNRPSREDDANSAAAHLLSYLLSHRLLPVSLMKKITSKMEPT